MMLSLQYLTTFLFAKIDKYKYIGTILNDHLNFRVTAEVLAGDGGRALGSVISKLSKL